MADIRLPEGWTRRPLLDVVSLPSGQVDPRESPYVDWPLLAPNHIESGTGRWTHVETAGEQGAISGKYTFEPGDVVYSKIRPYLQKVALVDRAGLCSADMYPMRCTPELVPGYLLSVLLSPGFTEFASSVSMRTGIPKINRKELAAYRVVLPPLPEQRKIAAILTAVDEAIEKSEAVIEQLGVVKKAMMQELLTRGLPGRHTRFKQTEIGEVPEEWEVVRIVDVASVDYGISAAVSKNTDPDIGWPILTGANITLGGSLDLSKLVYIPAPSKESFQLRNGDLLLNWRSGSPQHVGKTALYDLGPGYTYASFVLRVRCRERWFPGFGHLLLNFMRENEYFTRDLSQQVNFKMNATVFSDVLVLCPPMDEQVEVVRRVSVVDARAKAECAYARGLKVVKSALMAALLTGELRVTPDAP